MNPIKYKDDTRGIGDNAETPSEYLNQQIEYCYSALSYAVNLIARLTVTQVKLDKELHKVIYAKNNKRSGAATQRAISLNQDNIKNVKPFKATLDAIDAREDIHSGVHKSNKLDMCSVGDNFANFIANNAGGNEFDKAVSKSISDAELDKEFAND